MKQSLYELAVLVNNRKISEYSVKDSAKTEGYQALDHKTYVEGRAGSDFELKLTNHSDAEVLMIPSVDGLSVIDGKPADQNSKGYIVGAHDSITIPGWTLDDQSVAKFKFADRKKSYAAIHPDTPSEENIGVIGLLVWNKKKNDYQKILDEINKMKEKNPVIVPQPYPVPYPVYPKNPWNDYDWWKPYPVYPYYTITCISDITHTKGFSASSVSNVNVPTGSASCNILRSSVMPDSVQLNCSSNITDTMADSNDATFALGTEFGKQAEFKTVSQSFERDIIVATIALYYDTRKNLEKLGIVISKPKKEIKNNPNPFPGLTGCKAPANWKA